MFIKNLKAFVLCLTFASIANAAWIGKITHGSGDETTFAFQEVVGWCGTVPGIIFHDSHFSASFFSNDQGEIQTLNLFGDGINYKVEFPAKSSRYTISFNDFTIEIWYGSC